MLVQDLTTLSDIALSAPLTYVETFSGYASDCSTVPATVTEWRTASVDSVLYPAFVETYTLRTGTTYCTYTYPGLILTLLKPGDIVMQVSYKLTGGYESFYFFL